MTTSTPDDAARRPWLAGYAAFNAFAAWAGTFGLITGGTDFGEVINDRLPFDSVVLAGLALAAVVAIPLTLLAWSAWTGGARTADLAAIVGLMLIGWIVGQVAVIRAFSLFQPVYVAVGASLVAASHRVPLGPRRRGLLVIALGAVLTSVGVGLLPHPIKNGLTTWSVVSVVLVAAGSASVVVGAVSALRDRRRPGTLMGALGTVAAVTAAVSVIAPAVAATTVPSTSVTSTPASLGMEFEPVTLTTADGVQLGAWHVRGSNGAGVVVMHGSGSTRSDVLARAAVLARAGYGVVMIDARGHGDSGGRAMDFGWYGDLDIAAGTEFLASPAGVGPGRIGVVGFSMGGEEAIGAAAADRRIAAVVAEGATGRQASDKAWLSDVYGWRGWLQEQLEKVQYGITDYLTDASPPTALRAAVARASGTHFLLITAGNVDDERHAATHIRAGARDRVTVWDVDGADHIGGFETRPDEWRQRVLGFLDEHLR
jgi:dienelactone hydrolase